MDKAYRDSDILMVPVNAESREIIESARSVIAKNFREPTSHFMRMEAEDFRAHVARVQQTFSETRFSQRFTNASKAAFTEALGTSAISVQNGLFLRVARPQVTGVTEVVGFHREAFFQPDMRWSWNTWVPILNCTDSNAIYYVPESQKILGEKIQTKNVGEDNSDVKKFSAGHRIGLLYDDIQITGGVDLASARPMLVPAERFALFPSELIHGGGENYSDQLRISLDWRVIPSGKITENKPSFAMRGPFYSELSAKRGSGASGQ